MDSIFGIGLPELIVILILASLVMGPHRIRQVARTLGRVSAQLQGISRQFARQLNAELDALDDGELRDSMTDLRELQREVADLRRELGKSGKALLDEGQAAVEEGEATLRRRPSRGEDLPPQALPGPANPPEDRPRSPANGDSSAADSPLPQLLEIPDDPE
ncbi:MAG: twin-arginine translocase TatA/TatE family subunit [Candidatus Promineifilaceae bacterium]|nr:twin-arginine translocase TatA/TatE family subunit [Candidatus Promineifilaceae bacterium]